jgi:hypothetical protein
MYKSFCLYILKLYRTLRAGYCVNSCPRTCDLDYKTRNFRQISHTRQKSASHTRRVPFSLKFVAKPQAEVQSGSRFSVLKAAA